MENNIQVWLERLYREEIEEVEGTIENEKLWELGSENEEVANMHRTNIKELTYYKEVLEELIENLLEK